MDSSYTQSTQLLETFLSVLSAYRSAFGQKRVFERAGSLAFASSIAFARKTMTQLLAALGQLDRDWSAAYRLLSCGRFDSEAIASATFLQTLPHVPAFNPYTLVIDSTHVGRSSRKMPGTFWSRARGTAPWAPGFCRQQRFENICWLTPIQQGYRRAVPLRWIHTPSPKAVPSCDAACKEWEAGLTGIQWTRSQLDHAGRSSQELIVFADGSYDVNKLWTGLPPNTTLVTRCAKNRKLFGLASVDPFKRRGAHRKFGERAPAPSQMRKEKTYWNQIAIPVRGRLVHVKCRIEGPFLVEGASTKPLMLVLVKGYHLNGAKSRARKEPCQYLVNAASKEGRWGLPLPLEDLVEGTWHRWEIEVCHREIKTSFGLGQMQCWSKKGSTLSVEFVAWTYSLLVLAGYKAWGGLLGGPQSTRCRWWPGSRRWSMNALLQSFRQELWLSAKNRPGSTSTMPKGQIIDGNGLDWAVVGSCRG
jgi:hypothetical protein